MKIVFIISFCLFFSLFAFGQSEKTNNPAKVSIEEITMARDDGKGKPGEIADQFLTTDNSIHCMIQLNSLKSTTVKMILVAVKANGLKPETRSVSISYTTNGKQNRVNFNASPEDVWAAGDYRIDLFIDGRFARSHSFKIIEFSNEVNLQTLAAPESFTPLKSNRKSPHR